MLAIFQGRSEIIIIEMQNGKIPTKTKNQYFKNGGRDIDDYEHYVADESFLVRAEICTKYVQEPETSPPKRRRSVPKDPQGVEGLADFMLWRNNPQ